MQHVRVTSFPFTPADIATCRVLCKGFAFIAQVSESNMNDVTLVDVSRNLTGKYKCEVSAGSPSYHTLIKRSSMEVVGECERRPGELKSFAGSRQIPHPRFALASASAMPRDVMRRTCAATCAPFSCQIYGSPGRNATRTPIPPEDRSQIEIRTSFQDLLWNFYFGRISYTADCLRTFILCSVDEFVCTR